MDALFGNRKISFEALTDFSQLTASTKNHLKNVYTCLTLCTLAAAGGAFLFLKAGFENAGFLSTLLSIGLMVWLAYTSHTKENQTKRLCILAAFGGSMGFGLGPLLNFAIRINPQIIVTAFLASTAIFVCFSVSALYAQRRSYLYLGGFLGSALSLMLMMSLFNMFFRSFAIAQFSLYAGTAIFCVFILYDTQLIVEKHMNGDNDYIWHSVDLFLDFINIFRRLIVILGLNENNKKKRNN